MSGIDAYLAGFDEDAGYLDFAAFGPPSAAVRAETRAQEDELARARWGLADRLPQQLERLAAAAAAVTGFRPDQVSFQPSASEGLAQALFGVTGGVLLSPDDSNRLTTLAVRASDALQASTPLWLALAHGRVTPGEVRDQLTSTTTAVAVSAVDERTGVAADLDGLREVIGDRLLVVDAVQALGAADLDWAAADVLACGGSTWLRAGFGTGFVAISDRAANRLTPVLSGPWGAVADGPAGRVPDPAAGAAGLQLGRPDPAGAGRLAAALEELAAAGPAAVAARVADRAARTIAFADAAGLWVASPRASADRAGIVVLEPHQQHLTALTASLANHGVSATVDGGSVRLSPHAGTSDETLGLLRAALVASAAATRVYR